MKYFLHEDTINCLLNTLLSPDLFRCTDLKKQD